MKIDIHKLNKKLNREEAIAMGIITRSYNRVHKNKKAYTRKHYKVKDFIH